MLGCDYCPSIKGVGPKRAIELLQKHRSIEMLLEKLDKSKYHIPENWGYQEARKLFLDPEVADPTTIDVSIFQIHFSTHKIYCIGCST